MKKIYIAGCGGMLGEAFNDVFSKSYDLKCSDIDINENWLTFLNFNDSKSYNIDVKNFSPDALIHLGALTDLEYCEKNIDLTYDTNTTSVKTAVKISNDLSIPLIFISTAGIFGGDKDYYNDWDKPNPLNIYGKSKFLAENYIKSNKEDFLIIRAGWMMGGGIKKDKKFVKKIILQIKEGKKELFIVNDKMGTPTYTFDFANNVKLLLEKKHWGTFNMVCQGLTSRLEVANSIVEHFNLNDTIKVNEVDSNYFKENYFAERPLSERLINSKLDSKKINIMRNWKTCLKEYLNKDFKNILP